MSENSKKCYYCGPRYLPKFIKRWLDKYFANACKMHDDGYRQQSQSKTHYDNEFINNMLRVSDKWWKLVLAFYLYLWVKTFGWTSWFVNKIKYFYLKN